MKTKILMKQNVCFKCGRLDGTLLAVRDGKLNKKSGRRLATKYSHLICPSTRT